MRNNRYIKTDVVTFARNISNRHDFVRGYQDYMKDRPFDYENTNTYYERGRMFGVYSKYWKLPKATWRQNRLSKAAFSRLVSACNMGYVY